MTEIYLSDRAEEQLNKLEDQDEDRMIAKLKEAAEWPGHFLEPLKGGHYKLRSGEYRAIIEWERNDDRLLVKAVRHRRNIYDREL